MKRDTKILLEDILENIELIKRSTNKINKKSFVKNHPSKMCGMYWLAQTYAMVFDTQMSEMRSISEHIENLRFSMIPQGWFLSTTKSQLHTHSTTKPLLIEKWNFVV